MKKFFIIMLLCICFVLTGCSYGEVGLIQNSDGTVVEYYYIPFPETKLLENGLTATQLNQILINVKNDYEGETGILSQLMNDYQLRIADSNYSLEQKTAYISGVTYTMKIVRDADNHCTGIQYQFNFANSDCYLEFKEANSYIKEDRQIEEINYFFTTVTKVVKDPIFDKISNGAITLGQNCLNQVEKHMVNVLGESAWNELKYNIQYDKYSSQFNYTYVVPTARVHTNANSVMKKANGYYYHTWEVNLNNSNFDENSQIKIEYYTVTANKAIWYIFSLLIAGIIIASVYIVGKKKEQKESKQFKKE